MNKYDEKAQKMKAHLAAHPADYQTVISLFKVESAAINYERNKKKHLMMKEITKYMKAGEEDGEQTQYRRSCRGSDQKPCSDCQCRDAR